MDLLIVECQIRQYFQQNVVVGTSLYDFKEFTKSVTEATVPES